MKLTLQLYRNPVSGHCHRVELFLSLLGLPYESIDVDLANQQHKTPEFLAMNPLGQVPVLREGDLTLADSNAILVYLEARHAPGQWLPRDPVGERATLADVAHYAYVARAPEGLISLQPYPAIRAWLARIEALPGFVPMLKLPIGLAS